MNAKTITQTLMSTTSLTGLDQVRGQSPLPKIHTGSDPALEQVFREVENAIKAQLFHLSIVAALTIPAVCAALENDDGRSDGKHYKEWFDRFLAKRFPHMSRDDFYSLRCGVLHQGNMGLTSRGSKFSRVIFTLPEPRGNRFINMTVNDALQLDVVHFCSEMIQAGREWYDGAKSSEIVASNLPNLIRFRPQGIAPYIVGAPVIA